VRVWLHALWSSALFGIAACGDDGASVADAGYNCELEMRDDDYSMGMSRVGAGGYEVILVEGTPAPPGKGDNSWQLQVLDPAGTPQDGLAVHVLPCMPDHGHGTPIEAVVTAAGADGGYTAAPINLWMPGLWRVTIGLEQAAVQVPDPCANRTWDVDVVQLTFCIDG
jgi:hypothetical protein